VYPEEEVRAIVARALEAREAELRAEFASRLREQHAQFVTFHRDSVSRRIKAAECSYIS
jgi:hypothetical protein